MSPEERAERDIDLCHATLTADEVVQLRHEIAEAIRAAVVEERTTQALDARCAGYVQRIHELERQLEVMWRERNDAVLKDRAEEREALLSRFRTLQGEHTEEARLSSPSFAERHLAKAEAYGDAVKVIEARARDLAHPRSS